MCKRPDSLTHVAMQRKQIIDRIRYIVLVNITIILPIVSNKTLLFENLNNASHDGRLFKK